MKLIRQNGEVREMSALGRICGMRCDTIELDTNDVHLLYKCTPEQLKNIVEGWMTRFTTIPRG